MAQRNRATSRGKPNGRSAANDVLHLTDSTLPFQHQMLGLASLAAGTTRLMLRRTEAQLEFLNALSHCSDLAAVGAVTAEFTQKMGEEISAEWQEGAELAEHWMTAASQGSERMLAALAPAGQRAGSPR